MSSVRAAAMCKLCIHQTTVYHACMVWLIDVVSVVLLKYFYISRPENSNDPDLALGLRGWEGSIWLLLPLLWLLPRDIAALELGQEAVPRLLSQRWVLLEFPFDHQGLCVCVCVCVYGCMERVLEHESIMRQQD